MYQQLLRLCEAVEEVRTHARVINERMRRHLVRLAEHTSVAAAESRPQARSTWIHYARLSLTRLAAVLDVAECGKHLPTEALARVLGEMAALDGEFERAMAEPVKEPPPSPAPELAVVAVEEAAPQVVSDPPSADVLTDLRALAARDEPASRRRAKSSIVPSD